MLLYTAAAAQKALWVFQTTERTKQAFDRSRLEDIE